MLEPGALHMKVYYYVIKRFLVMLWQIFCCNLIWVCTKVIAASVVNILVKKIRKSVKNWQSYIHFKSVTKIGNSHKKWTHYACIVSMYLTTYIYNNSYLLSKSTWYALKHPLFTHKKTWHCSQRMETSCRTFIDQQHLQRPGFSPRTGQWEKPARSTVGVDFRLRRDQKSPIESRSVFATSLCLFCSQVGDCHFHACR